MSNRRVLKEGYVWRYCVTSFMVKKWKRKYLSLIEVNNYQDILITWGKSKDVETKTSSAIKEVVVGKDLVSACKYRGLRAHKQGSGVKFAVKEASTNDVHFFMVDDVQELQSWLQAFYEAFIFMRNDSVGGLGTFSGASSKSVYAMSTTCEETHLKRNRPLSATFHLR
ncbi:uncharacterized protein LOC144450754 [Glandiceps talaboti]